MPGRPLRYFDHASTTPVDPRVLKVMWPYMTEKFGNPNSLNRLGREAKRAMERARGEIANFLRCLPEEFVFVSSSTEADYLALTGAAKNHRHKGNKIIISAVEHKSIRNIAEELKREGFEVEVIPVDKNGVIDLVQLEQAIDGGTILVSITMVDSETGTIQPIAKISKLISRLKAKNKTDNLPLLHSDATQAATYLDLDVEKLGVDLLTICSHKLYGPKGIAGLYVRSGINIGRPRAGTANVPGIVGFGVAAKLNRKDKKEVALKVAKLRDELERGILETVPKVIINGNRRGRLPNFCNVSILDIEGEALLLYLDEFGVAASTGSACDAENLKPSAVLTALGRPYEYVHGSIRFSLGRGNSISDIRYVLRILPPLVEKLRKISPLCLML